MAVSLIARKYNGYYAQRPVLTTMITNAVRVLAADPPTLCIELFMERSASPWRND